MTLPGKYLWALPILCPRTSRIPAASGLGGSIATASDLVFIGATDDNRFRALDGKTGRELWSVKMDSAAAAVPSTYLGEDGKQYVVVCAAGDYFAAEPHFRRDHCVRAPAK